jgi:hypothetical protein
LCLTFQRSSTDGAIIARSMQYGLRQKPCFCLPLRGSSRNAAYQQCWQQTSRHDLQACALRNDLFHSGTSGTIKCYIVAFACCKCCGSKHDARITLNQRPPPLRHRTHITLSGSQGMHRCQSHRGQRSEMRATSGCA